ncbi:YicC/YloC family endoribonuclease [Methylocella silvestris]|uniref:YicC family protein n=1 Tax=Methylocella silvestris TaxID=199596 RepID=A0A2J7TJA6_METSI|nr:YicC/YloC family endoribonuclease [Methylocella silvestris]PNG26852.1 YicC family protein [Methylocella silvestris]
MTIASMTGFARIAGGAGAYSWAFELKSVNAKGFDLRLRLPQGFDPIEPEARRRLGEKLHRGTVYATLSAKREAESPEIRINQDLLGKLLAAVQGLDLPAGVAPARLDGLLALRGVVETVDAPESEAALDEARLGALKNLDDALDALVVMRRAEGAALGKMLEARLARIALLTQEADACPGRQPAAINARLRQAVEALCENTSLDLNRLHQEAAILAAKGDIREELDRLGTHASAAGALIAGGGPIGRKLDFLAQEMSREANTLSAKSNDAALTAIGMELRIEIEQFREQVQNVE